MLAHLKMDSLASATLLKADGSTVDATTALQGKVQKLYIFKYLSHTLFIISLFIHLRFKDFTQIDKVISFPSDVSQTCQRKLLCPSSSKCPSSIKYGLEKSLSTILLVRWCPFSIVSLF